MTFGSYARFARCRVPHLSPFARNLNVRLKMHRGICSTSLLRMAGEPRPIGGFVEQCSGTPSGVGRMCMGEGVEDGEDAASQALAQIISSVVEATKAVDNYNVNQHECGLWTWTFRSRPPRGM
mmetsp:Transcript_33753/g.100234  ORF Transcript_33753/g.100234 Transcript_33753/m.100234 type:complete len:123 (-) Transcript_33753:190-558(-)